METGGGSPDSLYPISGARTAPGVAGMWESKKDSRVFRWVISPDGQWQLRTNKLLEGPVAREGSCRVSPDGRWFIAYSKSARDHAILLDLETPGEPAYKLTGLSDYAADSTFSPDCRRLALRLVNQDIRLYDVPVDTGAAAGQSGELTGRAVFSQTGIIQRIAFSPDNKWLAMTGGADLVTLVPLDGPGEPVQLHLPGGDGWAAGFSADGRWLVAGGNHRVVHLWNMDNIRTGAPPLDLRGMTTPVGEAGFSPDGTTIYAIGMAGVVRRWPFDSASGAAMPHHLQAGAFEVIDVAVSPDNDWIASACAGNILPGRENEEGFVTVTRDGGRG
jgi:WD40 repeat protein